MENRIPYYKLPECNPDEHPECSKTECFINGGECHKRVPKCSECHYFDQRTGCFLYPRKIVAVNDWACSSFLEEALFE